MSSTVAVTPAPPSARRHKAVWLAVLGAALVVAVAASIALGARPLSLPQVWDGLTGSGAPDVTAIIRSLRSPRTALGVVVGAALGIAGALIQGHTRNPLADPGLLGVNAGAAFAVVVAIYLLRISDPMQYLVFAFLGAAAASALVFGLSAVGTGRADPLSLVLAGAAVSAFLVAATTAVVLIDVTSLDGMRFWVVGALGGRGTDLLWAVLPFIAVGAVMAIASGPSLNLLGMGEDVARALGVHVGLARGIGIVAITLLAGAATAACGPIAFLGLVVPHIVRAATGPDYRWIVPCSALAGAVLLLACDTLGRLVARPGELQVGIVLAVVGGPFFVALVRRRKLAAL